MLTLTSHVASSERREAVHHRCPQLSNPGSGPVATLDRPRLALLIAARNRDVVPQRPHDYYEKGLGGSGPVFLRQFVSIVVPAFIFDLLIGF